MNNLLKKFIILIITLFLNINCSINPKKYKNFNRKISHIRRYGIPAKLISRIKNKKKFRKNAPLIRLSQYRNNKSITKKIKTPSTNNIKKIEVETVTVNNSFYKAPEKKFKGDLNETIQLSWYLSENYRPILNLFKDFFLKNVNPEFKKNFDEIKKNAISNLIAYKEAMKRTEFSTTQFQQLSILKNKEEDDSSFVETINKDDLINLSNRCIQAVQFGDRFTLRLVSIDGENIKKEKYLKDKNFFIFDEKLFEILFLCSKIFETLKIVDKKATNTTFKQEFKEISKNFISEYKIFEIKDEEQETKIATGSEEEDTRSGRQQAKIISTKSLFNIISLSKTTYMCIEKLIEEKRDILNMSGEGSKWKKWLKIGVGATLTVGAGLAAFYYRGPALNAINEAIPKMLESVKNFNKTFFKKTMFDASGKAIGTKQMNWGEKIITCLNWPYSNLVNMFCKKAEDLATSKSDGNKESFKNKTLEFAAKQVQNTVRFVETGAISSYLPNEYKPKQTLAKITMSGLNILSGKYFFGENSIATKIKNKFDKWTNGFFSKALDYTSIFGIIKKISTPILRTKIAIPFKLPEATKNIMIETALSFRINEMLHGSDAMNINARKGFEFVNSALNTGNSYIQSGRLDIPNILMSASRFIPNSLNPLAKAPWLSNLISAGMDDNF